MFLGYNGFPKGISDTEERWGPDNKYNYVIHAEENALIKALMGLGIRVRECELYVTLQPCHMCMRLIVQCGIKTVYYLNARPDPITAEMAREAGVTVSKFEVEKIDWPVSRGTSSSELLNLFAEGEKYGTTDRVSDR
jgi:dCMP deaminase